MAIDSRQRTIEATYACVARRGIAKTTVEDVAREAGISRATVYRAFPGGRDELIDATISWAVLDFFAWAYKAGGEMAKSLSYVPMPPDAVAILMDCWKQIVGPDGKPVWDGHSS